MVFGLFQYGYSKDVTLKTKYASISINEKGFITSIKDLKRGKECAAKGQYQYSFFSFPHINLPRIHFNRVFHHRFIMTFFRYSFA